MNRFASQMLFLRAGGFPLWRTVSIPMMHSWFIQLALVMGNTSHVFSIWKCGGKNRTSLFKQSFVESTDRHRPDICCSIKVFPQSRSSCLWYRKWLIFECRFEQIDCHNTTAGQASEVEITGHVTHDEKCYLWTQQKKIKMITKIYWASHTRKIMM